MRHTEIPGTPLDFGDIKVGDYIRATHPGGDVVYLTAKATDGGDSWVEGSYCAIYNSDEWTLERLPVVLPTHRGAVIAAPHIEDADVFVLTDDGGWRAVNGGAVLSGDDIRGLMDRLDYKVIFDGVRIMETAS